MLGQDNASVFHGTLGVSEAEFAEPMAEGVIGAEAVPVDKRKKRVPTTRAA